MKITIGNISDLSAYYRNTFPGFDSSGAGNTGDQGIPVFPGIPQMRIGLEQGFLCHAQRLQSQETAPEAPGFPGLTANRWKEAPQTHRQARSRIDPSTLYDRIFCLKFKQLCTEFRQMSGIN
ncbi:hypothetical protein [Thiohalophilus sp.]|uniref:hypothetical protein n=1 Tax=Thiohalophilus sp. TaxID=3028392 RepID=UPI002ACDB1D3|nr:hypothetical protein [Thiohalophilus sp.]MDZ7662998.1 hypothetical protein [Thiohalophilus sp.]MDZ7804148.1 hypothetical protein [Thiohalophilus sp.]